MIDHIKEDIFHTPTHVEVEPGWEQFFVGRENELEQVAETLIMKDRRLVVIYGRRGQGRTAVARMFAHRYSAFFSDINLQAWEVVANTPSLRSPWRRLPPKKTLLPRLLVWDLEQPINDKLFSILRRLYNEDPRLKIIVINSKPISDPIVDLNVHIAPLTREEFFELVQKRFNLSLDMHKFDAAFDHEWRENGAFRQLYEYEQAAYLKAIGSGGGLPEVYSSKDVADTIRFRLEVLKRNLDLIAPFRQIGILGPDGQPLSAPGKSKVAADIRFTNSDLISILNRNPELMRKIDPLKFEELIADILDKRGYSVSRTPFVDGGVDLFAAKNDSVGRFLLLVQCKRYGGHRPVDVRFARELVGVVESKRATAGLLVTSSHFTRPTLAYQRTVEHRLSLKDYLDVRSWLSEFAG